MKTIELTDEETEFLRELCKDESEYSQEIIDCANTMDGEAERVNRLSKSILDKL